MFYANMVPGIFLDRPNRFIAPMWKSMGRRKLSM